MSGSAGRSFRETTLRHRKQMEEKLQKALNSIGNIGKRSRGKANDSSLSSEPPGEHSIQDSSSLTDQSQVNGTPTKPLETEQSVIAETIGVGDQPTAKSIGDKEGQNDPVNKPSEAELSPVNELSPTDTIETAKINKNKPMEENRNTETREKNVEKPDEPLNANEMHGAVSSKNNKQEQPPEDEGNPTLTSQDRNTPIGTQDASTENKKTKKIEESDDTSKKTGKKHTEKRGKKDKKAETVNPITNYTVSKEDMPGRSAPTSHPKQGEKGVDIEWKETELRNSTPFKGRKEPTKSNPNKGKKNQEDWQKDKEAEYNRIISIMESDEESQESDTERDEMEPIKSKEMQDAESDGEPKHSSQDLMKFMVQMADRLEHNQKVLVEGLHKNIKSTVGKEVKAKSSEIKTSLAEYLSTEITSIRSQVQDSLDKMNAKINSKVTSTRALDKKLEEFKDTLDLFNDRYEDHENWRKEVETKDRERVQVFNEVIDRVSTCEDNDTELFDGWNNMERRWRRYNVRISCLKTKSKNEEEDVKETVAKFIKDKELLPGYTSLAEVRGEIEVAFRIGKKVQGKPKQILTRFFSYEVRDELVKVAKSKKKAEKIKPVYLQNDLSPTDYGLKSEAHAYMQKAHAKKKFPRFYKGTVKVSENGKILEIPRTDVISFNSRHNVEFKEVKGAKRQKEKIKHVQPIQSSPVPSKEPKKKAGENKKNKASQKELPSLSSPETTREPKDKGGRYKKSKQATTTQKATSDQSKRNKGKDTRKKEESIDESSSSDSPASSDTEPEEQAEEISSEEEKETDEEEGEKQEKEEEEDDEEPQSSNKDTSSESGNPDSGSESEPEVETKKQTQEKADKSIEELSVSMAKLKGIINDSSLMTKKMKRKLEIQKREMIKLLEFSPKAGNSKDSDSE